jgi:hypothetical protein
MSILWSYLILSVVAITGHGNAIHWRRKHDAQTPGRLGERIRLLKTENTQYRKELARVRKDLSEADYVNERQRVACVGYREEIERMRGELERVSAKVKGEGRGSAAEVVVMN